MQEKQSSTTAEGMALVRAIESSRPAQKRLFNDPLARALVNPISVWLSKATINSGLYARAFNGGGTIEFITARERCIDDFLKACLAEGLDQVVILGAGFDTRAYRIPEMAAVRVFEVDHPATQAEKVKRLRKVVEPLPANVTFVPLDFNTQDLGAQLRAAGYNPQAKTLFIWQGVVMYLEAAAVDATLAFIAHNAAPGSAVVFDYFYNETLRVMAAQTQRILRNLGERLTFGIDAGTVASFLTQRGFTDVRDVDAAELDRRYFTGANAGRHARPGAGIVSARVA